MEILFSEWNGLPFKRPHQRMINFVYFSVIVSSFFFRFRRHRRCHGGIWLWLMLWIAVDSRTHYPEGQINLISNIRMYIIGLCGLQFSVIRRGSSVAPTPVHLWPTRYSSYETFMWFGHKWKFNRLRLESDFSFTMMLMIMRFDFNVDIYERSIVNEKHFRFPFK